jgi:hypothetical protein
VEEWLKLHNLHIHHVTIQHTLRYLIAVKVVMLKSGDCVGNTGPIATVREYGVVKPIAMFRFQLELQLKLHRQFAPVTNTNQNI